MRKLIALVLLAALSAACSGSGGSSPAASGGSSPAAPIGPSASASASVCDRFPDLRACGGEGYDTTTAAPYSGPESNANDDPDQGSGNQGSGNQGSGNSGGGSPQGLSVAYKLAVIDGDPSEEAAFQAVIDCIMASGIKGAETERKVGDVLVASWEQSGKQLTLLEWAQLLCSA